MICSLILGRKGSVGFPGKNTHFINGKPLSWYPMNAASKCMRISNHFISTDDEDLAKIGMELGFSHIVRPTELATSSALGDDAYKHGFDQICKELGKKPELLVLLFCNAPTVTPEMINKGIEILESNPEADSAVTVSKYNMFSPSRARRLDNSGYLKPYIPFEKYDSSSSINCDRDSQGDVWFADVAVSVVRAKNLEDLDGGLLPQKWMGKKIMPIYNVAGLDIDYEWQLGQVKWWLDEHGR